MLQTINPYGATSKTAEIMSRYRPIAPKPQIPTTTLNTMSEQNDQNSVLPQNIQKSPYLRSVWAHLQARPTRTRKRGRTAAFAAPPSLKRTRTCPPHHHQLPPNGLILPQISLLPLNCGLDTPVVTTLAESVAAMPLLTTKTIDLNIMEAADDQGLILMPPRELDFMPQLKEPVKPPPTSTVISPRPVRPIGSRILVKILTAKGGCAPSVKKAEEEVEEEVEAEGVPIIVSDSGNRVRLANSAYKEMVGQPECCWLDCVGRCTRIGGEVLLKFEDPNYKSMDVLSMMHGGFECSGKIEWESSDGKKRCVDVCCDGVKLACEGKDYQFLWRFRLVRETRNY